MAGKLFSSAAKASALYREPSGSQFTLTTLTNFVGARGEVSIGGLVASDEVR